MSGSEHKEKAKKFGVRSKTFRPDVLRMRMRKKAVRYADQSPIITIRIDS